VQAVLDRLSLGQQRALLGCRAALLSQVRQLGRRLRRHHLLECRSRRGRRHRTRRRHRWCPTAVRGDQVGRHRLPGVLGRSGAEVSGGRAVPPIRPRETRPSVRPRAGGKGSHPTSPTSRCLSSTSLCCPSSSAAPITPRTRRAWAQPRRASLLYLLRVVTGLVRARRVPSRRPVRRALDAMTGVALLGCSAKLAVDDK
jgi:hypothetical protein